MSACDDAKMNDLRQLAADAAAYLTSRVTLRGVKCLMRDKQDVANEVAFAEGALGNIVGIEPATGSNPATTAVGPRATLTFMVKILENVRVNRARTEIAKSPVADLAGRLALTSADVLPTQMVHQSDEDYTNSQGLVYPAYYWLIPSAVPNTVVDPSQEANWAKLLYAADVLDIVIRCLHNQWRPRPNAAVFYVSHKQQDATNGFAYYAEFGMQHKFSDELIE